jgi:putative PIN family toxin of toxin-antitoxin system
MHNANRFVVIDTNVLVSTLLTPYGTAAKSVGFVASGTLIPCYNAQILNEYHTVLFRAKFHYEKLLVSQLLALIQDLGVSVTAKPSTIDLPDESDRKFYDVAKTVSAYLVTGNTRHFPKEDRVLTPAELVRLFTS